MGQNIDQSSKPYAIFCNQELFPQLIKSLSSSCHVFCVKKFVLM